MGEMNILEYVEMLIENGYTQEDAERCADVMFNDDYDYD